ncbi:hypothetical protein AB1D47_001600 [Enterobacter hormaechei]
MKKTWFHHTDCTTQQSEELIAEYQRRGVKVERNLNSDYLTWTVHHCGQYHIPFRAGGRQRQRCTSG